VRIFSVFDHRYGRISYALEQENCRKEEI
jgi:hypothetical protein